MPPTILSAPAPPSSVSLPPLPTSVSSLDPASRLLLPELPVSVLALLLPVASMLPVPVSVRFST
ncbi:MAG: hypothetical protein C0606_10950 [Hyphomicrobiales bacterium]|nr:MAG: hypothetical protein C0606_10950 [Hyphomicrobiales bacterium]